MATPAKQMSMPITALRNLVRLSDPHITTMLHDAPGPLIGLADGDEPVTLSAEPENVLVATGPGGGTTTVLRTLAAQALARGAAVDVLDPTGTAHPWTKKLPGAATYSRISHIHDYLLQTAQSLTSAPRGARGWAGRRVIVLESCDQVVYALRQFWGHTRPDSQLEDSPAIEALARMMVAGPSRNLQVLADSPRGTVPALHDLPADEVFPLRISAYSSASVWARMAPDIWPAPRYSLTPGRMHAVADRQVTALQALFLTPGEARALARGLTCAKENRP
ncbi:cell division protein FtsK [Streptomyces sp. NPDC021100]|uniref:cell division protein FtsK n=1 Tax=Streptomyces sp. NPDC021100 TaxID=3365114 RepID=UPI00378C4AE2